MSAPALRAALVAVCAAWLATLGGCDGKKPPSSPPKPSTEASSPATGR